MWHSFFQDIHCWGIRQSESRITGSKRNSTPSMIGPGHICSNRMRSRTTSSEATIIPSPDANTEKSRWCDAAFLFSTRRENPLPRIGMLETHQVGGGACNHFFVLNWLVWFCREDCACLGVLIHILSMPQWQLPPNNRKIPKDTSNRNVWWYVTTVGWKLVLENSWSLYLHVLVTAQRTEMVNTTEIQIAKITMTSKFLSNSTTHLAGTLMLLKDRLQPNCQAFTGHLH